MLQVGDGIARIYGLSNIQAGELIEFPERNVTGMVLNLEEDNVRGCTLWGSTGGQGKETKPVVPIESHPSM